MQRARDFDGMLEIRYITLCQSSFHTLAWLCTQKRMSKVFPKKLAMKFYSKLFANPMKFKVFDPSFHLIGEIEKRIRTSGYRSAFESQSKDRAQARPQVFG
jgi:hypothetical protein